MDHAERLKEVDPSSVRIVTGNVTHGAKCGLCSRDIGRARVEWWRVPSNGGGPRYLVHARCASEYEMVVLAMRAPH